MPDFTHLRLVRPAGQIIETETPNRLALRNALGVDSLPPVSQLPEDAAAGMTVDQFANTYCLIDAALDTPAARAARPWCAGRFIVTTSTAPTPNRNALWARLGVPSLPPLSLLSEALAGTITDAEYYAQFCLPITSGGVTTYSPWCGPDYHGPPAPPPPVVLPPLIPGYGAGRIPPAEHYPTWAALRYILGTEKEFLLALPPDEYYRLVDKFTQGPAALHQAIRIEATRRGVADPLAGIIAVEMAISNQQADWLGHTTIQPTPAQGSRRSAWVPVLVVGALVGAAWYWWPSKKR